GKKILVQRKGRGGSWARSPSWRSIGPVRYPVGDFKGVVEDIVHDPIHFTPIAIVKGENGGKILHLAPVGLSVGDTIQIGTKEIKPGNVLKLRDIPEGTSIFNVELRPGDGGKLARSSGARALVIVKTDTHAKIRLPSMEEKEILLDCRATIGVAGGGGRTEKPFLKAGKKYHYIKNRATKWPVVRGVAMNAVAHPITKNASKTVSRHAPPGAKVGLISARRSGRGRNK
ncbi:MAG: 50S ribosomal protein L2, partial [Candidatus Korarchaeota archaeon]